MQEIEKDKEWAEEEARREREARREEMRLAAERARLQVCARTCVALCMCLVHACVGCVSAVVGCLRTLLALLPMQTCVHFTHRKMNPPMFTRRHRYFLRASACAGPTGRPESRPWHRFRLGKRQVECLPEVC